ncbi:MAG: hypothetical protein JRI25_29025 [Deltaproteobacteria bacterium]|nr:hypothetical protein [Deltaproteobacteria bacterium]
MRPPYTVAVPRGTVDGSLYSPPWEVTMRLSLAALFLALTLAPGCDDLPTLHKEVHDGTHAKSHHNHAEADSFDVKHAQAMERYHEGDYDAFVPLQEEVVAAKGRDVDVYNLACGYALTGRTEEALDSLEVVAERSADLPMEKGSATTQDSTTST